MCCRVCHLRHLTYVKTLTVAVVVLAHQIVLAEWRSMAAKNRSVNLSCCVPDRGVRLPSVNANCYFCLRFDSKAGSEAHATSRSMEWGDFILAVRRPELEADNTSVEL